ncbi:hypothetical protein CBOM_00658 [Ceraceosorus bombacis]|uniref:Uncharacterized protein n=1 Tax=Ceraceosorus bombacis TaxID=401625 RepID=A0A0P1B9M3_9BASI|nr:hypothetical protein CBOM_00658 [Ceraceosorus bombacis]
MQETSGSEGSAANEPMDVDHTGASLSTAARAPVSQGSPRQTAAEQWLEGVISRTSQRQYDFLLHLWSHCGPEHAEFPRFIRSADHYVSALHSECDFDPPPERIRNLFKGSRGTSDYDTLQRTRNHIISTSAGWQRRRNDHISDWAGFTRLRMLELLCHQQDQSNPAVRSHIYFKQYNRLSEAFFETDYLGTADDFFVRTLADYEARFTPERLEAVSKIPRSADEEGTKVPLEVHGDTLWHSRSLAIIQSSGTGKSRLVERLNGRVSCDQQPSEVHLTFSLCLRREDEAAFPLGDWRFYEWLTEDLRHVVSYPSPHAVALVYNIRWMTLLRAIYQASATAVCRMAGEPTAESLAEHWKTECGAKIRTLEDDTRHEAHADVHLYNETERLAEDLWSSALSSLSRAGKAFIDHERYESVHQLNKRLLREDAMSLYQSLDTIHDTRACFTKDFVATSKFSWVERLRSVFCPDDGELELPPRFWLIMLGTNASFAALTPLTKEASSFRIASGRLSHFPPYMHTSTNVWLTAHEDYKRKIFTASPYTASRPHLLARWGRPLWQSVMSYDKTTPMLADPASSLSGEYLSFVTRKLLKAGSEQNELFEIELTSERCFALLSQRIMLDDGHDYGEFGDPHSHRVEANKQAYVSLQRQQVDEHLRMLYALSTSGDTLGTYIACEPLVSHAAAVFMARPRDPTASKATVWARCWEQFRALVGNCVVYDQGTYGEITAQALLTVCKDATPRPSAGASKLPNQLASTDPVHHFVELRAYLETLFSTQNMKKSTRTQGAENAGQAAWAKLLESTGDVWVNFTRFHRLRRLVQTINTDVLWDAWVHMTAIVGAKGQANWDLLIPVYCGTITEPLNPLAFSFIEVQVKAHKTPYTAVMEPSATAEFLTSLVQPPIILLLNVGNSAANNAEVIVQPHLPSTRIETRNTRSRKRYWQISTRGLLRVNHPGLDALLPSSAGMNDFSISKHPPEALDAWSEQRRHRMEARNDPEHDEWLRNLVEAECSAQNSAET